MINNIKLNKQFSFYENYQLNCKEISPALDLLQLVDLVGQLVLGIGGLLLEGGDGGLVLELVLLEVAAQLEQLSLALLVELDLGSGGAAGLVKALRQVVELAGQLGALLLHLGAVLALSLQLLLELLDASLKVKVVGHVHSDVTQ